MPTRTKEEVSKMMRGIRSQNTKIEVMVGKALWRKGYRYRKNNKSVYGTPDFTFKKYKLAIFCDSNFWHGKDWGNLSKKLKTNREFWIKKIERNIERDKKVNKELKKLGWVVLRFWESDIEKNILSVISTIEVSLFILKKFNEERGKVRLQYRKASKESLRNKYLGYLSDEELIQYMPHLYE